MFNQKDPAWSDFPIGDSDLHMGTEGCLTTIQAEAMYMAGYTSLTPATLCTNAFLFTNKHYGESSPGAGDGQAGLWLWYKMGEIYSQYHVYLNDQARFKFVQVTATWSGRRYQHWVLLVDGQYRDPIDGSISPTLKPNYVPTGRVYSADIAAAPIPDHQHTFEPFQTNLEPSQAFNEEVGRMQDYLTARGLMENPGTERGYYGPRTQKAVDAFQKSQGIQAYPQYFGYWYDLTRAAANNNLTF